MEEEIYTLLSNGVTFPVAWGSLGQDDGLPRAAIYRVSGAREMTLTGLGLMQGRIQIDCYGETFAEAIGASRDIRDLLEGYSGGVVQGVFLEAVRDQFTEDAQLLQRVSLTFSMTYRD